MYKQVDKSHYFNQKYNHKARWLSYWYQIDLVIGTKSESILEIGLGSGVVKDYLQKIGLSIKTLDIDSELNPDIVGSIENIPANDNSYDCILAAEVLEHLRFEKFIQILGEMKRVSREYAIISLPDARRTLINWYLKIPFLPSFKIFIKIPFLKEHKFDGQHYWEVGKKNYSLKQVRKVIIKSGWKIEKSFTSEDVPTKHFFLLQK